MLKQNENYKQWVHAQTCEVKFIITCIPFKFSLNWSAVFGKTDEVDDHISLSHYKKKKRLTSLGFV